MDNKIDTAPSIPNWAAEAERALDELEAQVATAKISLKHALARAFLVGARVEIEARARGEGPPRGYTPVPVTPRRPIQ